jgi:hypothetical protein
METISSSEISAARRKLAARIASDLEDTQPSSTKRESRRMTNAEMAKAAKPRQPAEPKLVVTARGSFYALDYVAQLDAYIRKYRE